MAIGEFVLTIFYIIKRIIAKMRAMEASDGVAEGGKGGEDLVGARLEPLDARSTPRFVACFFSLGLGLICFV